MKAWTIAEMVLGVLAIGAFGMVTFSVSPIWETLLGVLIAAAVVVGVIGPIVLKNRNADWHC